MSEEGPKLKDILASKQKAEESLKKKEVPKEQSQMRQKLTELSNRITPEDMPEYDLRGE